MKKEQAEPLIELLYQEFPNKDPVEIEQVINTVKKWLEQEITRIEQDKETLSKKFHIKIDPNPNNDSGIIELKCLIHQLMKNEQTE